jgi:hypothetical protein
VILEFERTIEDLIDFNMFHMAHSPSIKRQYWNTRIWTTILVTLLLLSVIFLLTHSLSTFDYVYSFLGSALIFWGYPYGYKREMIHRLYKLLGEGENESVLGSCTITLSPDGIYTKTEKSEGKINWSAVIKTVQSEKHIFLYIGSVNAFVIPKAAFANNKTKQEFLDYVSANVKNRNV